MKYQLTFLLFISGMTHTILSQVPNPEIGSFEYTLVPNAGDTQIEIYNANLNFGTKLKKGMLGFGISYTFYDFMFKDNSFSTFNLNPYREIHNVRLRIFYRYNINDSWSGNLMFSPTLSSDLKNSISSEDIIFNSAFSISKKWGTLDKFTVFSFGLGFGTPFGEPQLFPVLSLRKKINQNWSYNLGIPATHLDYRHNIRHTFSAKIAFQGLFGNISSTVALPDYSQLTNTKIQYNTLNTGLDYNYRIQPNWTTSISIGYSPWNRLLILDEANDELYDLQADGSLYVSMGIKFNLNNTKNENNK